MLSSEQVLKGLTNPREAINWIALRTLDATHSRIIGGENIFDKEWDVLLVLDACRYDLFEEFAPYHNVYQYFDTVSSVRSPASMTVIWLNRTFKNAPADLVKSTHYVSGAGQSERCLSEDKLHKIDHVWKYALDPDYGQTQPQAVTDATIDAIRNSSAERVIAHYTEPHAPFLHCVGKYDSKGKSDGGTQNVWKGLEQGKYDKKEVWEDYGKNLLRVLDEVKTIIENTDGKVVVTSDHGNAFGEWGIYGHPRYVPIKVLRSVPWVEANGCGEKTYEINGVEEMTTEEEEPTLNEHLEALGYR